MPSKHKLQRKLATAKAEVVVLQALVNALYEALECQARGANAAAFEAGIAEGTQEALAVDQELRDLLENEG